MIKGSFRPLLDTPDCRKVLDFNVKRSWLKLSLKRLKRVTRDDEEEDEEDDEDVIGIYIYIYVNI
jgi:hypothetical protein